MTVKELDSAVDVPVQLIGSQPNSYRQRSIAVELGKVVAQNDALLSLVGSFPVGEEEELVLDDRAAELVADLIAVEGKRRWLIVQARTDILVSPEVESTAVELIASA